MRDVAAEMGLSEAAIHRYTGSKEDLFVSALRHSLPLEDMPVGDLPLPPTPLAAAVWEAREFVAEAVPVHALFPASAVAAGGR
jgi:AcrR family transcriptional regulator